MNSKKARAKPCGHWRYPAVISNDHAKHRGLASESSSGGVASKGTTGTLCCAKAAYLKVPPIRPSNFVSLGGRSKSNTMASPVNDTILFRDG